MNEYKDLQKIVVDDTTYESRLTTKFVTRKQYAPKDPKKITAIIPGIIREIFVKKGQEVKRNESLLVLEAMKMMNTLKAPVEGRIKAVYVKQGKMVAKGELLVEFE